jgi:hypothetical protein
MTSDKSSQFLSSTQTHLSRPSASKLYDISEPTSVTRPHHTNNTTENG